MPICASGRCHCQGESAKYTTYTTPFGCYYFNRAPFGIASVPEHFQRRMPLVLEGLSAALCPSDDVLIWGMSQEGHNKRLPTPQKAGIAVKMEKLFSSSDIRQWSETQPGEDEHCADMRAPSGVGELCRCGYSARKFISY